MPNTHRYIRQIDVLFWTGRLQGNTPLELHEQLQAYLGGEVSNEDLQTIINLYECFWMP
ncbi:hypothetical protein [Leptolyngbya ohadii]|uniref:hypothetical protein n=1 Tax=Leptolyngbya ohadii TaxID=1962290 RepID=UPI0015C62342|nr:hypothetical protein [Leptolyngbya ohadii]